MYILILWVNEEEYESLLPLGEGVSAYSIFHRDLEVQTQIKDLCKLGKARIEYTPTMATKLAYVINRLDDDTLRNLELRKATFKGAHQVWVLREGK